LREFEKGRVRRIFGPERENYITQGFIISNLD
jgi:hypothetical protein